MDSTTPNHPVFKELLTRLQSYVTYPDPNPEEWDFETCPAWAKSRRRQCKNKPKKPGKAEELRSRLALMKECPTTDEFFDQLEDFLTVSQCHIHAADALKGLKEWRNSETTAADISSDDLTASSDDDEQSNTLTDLHVTVPRQSPSPVPEQAIGYEIASKTGEIYNRIETVAESMSTMNLGVANQTTIKTTVIRNNGDANVTPVERVIRVGLATLQRRGSLRDDSPIFSEIFKPLTAIQRDVGVVYVLEHMVEKGLFKIGWTRTNPSKRRNQPDNCFKSTAEVIYESRGGPFFAACKAERLAQAVLRHHKLSIVECEQCGGGHREWFRASRERVLETVQIMETFIRLPAYESKDGDWKLSDVAFGMIKTMCEFSPGKLKSVITTTETHSVEATDGHSAIYSKQEAIAQVASVRIPSSSLESDEAGDKDAVLDSVEAIESSTNIQESNGSRTTRFAKGTKVVYTATKRRVSSLLSRSREGTAEPEDADERAHTKPGSRNGNESGDFKTAIGDIFWSMFSEEDRSLNNNKEVPQGDSWIGVVKKDFRKFIKDFERGWNDEDEIPRKY
ncbi:hypothetical protein S40293_02280 [Stachybotrys chartarum IBT 40293]|nr:hypothetical protein S40293_02280 [Stachybotrys chartarum IBT 40293]